MIDEKHQPDGDDGEVKAFEAQRERALVPTTAASAPETGNINQNGTPAPELSTAAVYAPMARKAACPMLI